MMNIAQKCLSFFLMLMLTGSVFADSASKMQTVVDKTKRDFVVCDVAKLTAGLPNTTGSGALPFTVKYLADNDANYNYYLITDRGALNADKIRKATCQYVMDNKCYIYWGNVVNVAMVADKKAPWFPGDATPHYVLSPDITCNKIIKKKFFWQK